MRIIVIGAGDLGSSLAAHLEVGRHERVSLDMPDDFVLDGTRLSVTGARALDVVLHARAAAVDAVLWVRDGDPAVLEHYRGRVIALDGATDLLDSALDRLREVLLAC
jgi:hypothetical protein